MTARTWIVVAASVSLLAAATYYVTLPATPRLTLACPLPPDERAQRPGMVWVPAGTVTMGSDVYPEETHRTVTVKGFWIDRTEVTNAEFAAFGKATK